MKHFRTCHQVQKKTKTHIKVYHKQKISLVNLLRDLPTKTGEREKKEKKRKAIPNFTVLGPSVDAGTRRIEDGLTTNTWSPLHRAP